jgi:hypothetical protein
MMSAEKRAERRANFTMPSKAEIDAMRTLEAEREQRRSQRYMREQQRAQTELQRAGICGNLILQLNPSVDSNAKLLGQTRHYLETYFDKVTPDLEAPPEPDDADTDQEVQEGLRSPSEEPGSEAEARVALTAVAHPLQTVTVGPR